MNPGTMGLLSEAGLEKCWQGRFEGGFEADAGCDRSSATLYGAAFVGFGRTAAARC